MNGADQIESQAAEEGEGFLFEKAVFGAHKGFLIYNSISLERQRRANCRCGLFTGMFALTPSSVDVNLG